MPLQVLATSIIKIKGDWKTKFMREVNLSLAWPNRWSVGQRD